MRNSRTGHIVYDALAVLTFVFLLAYNHTAAADNLSATVASTHVSGLTEKPATGGHITPYQFVGGRAGSMGLMTSIKWQSGVNVAGSRAWAKVIRFSDNGINIRMPLN